MIHGEDDLDSTVRVPKPAPGTQPRTVSSRMWQPPSVEELQHALPQYEVQAFIARGGMGAVYRGVQRSAGPHGGHQDPAAGIADDDDEVNCAQRFKREARAMAQPESSGHRGRV